MESHLKLVLKSFNFYAFLQIGEVKERRKAVVRPRDKIYAATKTAIVDKSQASEAKTDKYVRQGSSYCTVNRFENLN